MTIVDLLFLWTDTVVDSNWKSNAARASGYAIAHSEADLYCKLSNPRVVSGQNMSKTCSAERISE